MASKKETGKSFWEARLRELRLRAEELKPIFLGPENNRFLELQRLGLAQEWKKTLVEMQTLEWMLHPPKGRPPESAYDAAFWHKTKEPDRTYRELARIHRPELFGDPDPHVEALRSEQARDSTKQSNYRRRKKRRQPSK